MSHRFAHILIEIALDSNIHKKHKDQIDISLKQFNRFNNKEIIYLLAGFIKISEKLLIKIMETVTNLIKLSTKFTIRSLLKRAKITEQFFQKEFKRNASFIKNIFKIIPAWKYSIELTKDYKRYLG